MHAASLARSKRLQRIHGVLARGGWHSTLEISLATRAQAVSSAISELRANGAVIACRRRQTAEAPVWEYCMTSPAGDAPDADENHEAFIVCSRLEAPGAAPAARNPRARSIRHRLLAAIHVRAKELGLDEDARRNNHHFATGKRSCADMSDAELRRALGALDKISERSARLAVVVNSSADESRRKMLGKIQAQCRALAVSIQYAEGIARQMHKRPLGDLAPQQLKDVISALAVRQKKQA